MKILPILIVLGLTILPNLILFWYIIGRVIAKGADQALKELDSPSIRLRNFINEHKKIFYSFLATLYAISVVGWGWIFFNIIAPGFGVSGVIWILGGCMVLAEMAIGGYWSMRDYQRILKSNPPPGPGSSKEDIYKWQFSIQKETAKNFHDRVLNRSRILLVVSIFVIFIGALILYILFASSYQDKGLKHINDQQYTLAIDDLNISIKLDSTNYYSYLLRGFAYEYQKEFDKAILDYSKSIELNPEIANTYNNRGYTYQNIEKYNLALEDYNTAIKLDPTYEIAYVNRGYLYEQMGQYQNARTDYFKVIGMSNNSTYVKRAQDGLRRLSSK